MTAAKVVEWPGDSGCQILFHRDGLAEPLGYLELNPMPTEQRHFWLGHCVIQPDSRGVGLGRLMVDLALDEAFEHHLATSVSLVVFPDNVAAIRCYRAVGFVDAGHQVKYFHTTGRQHRMLRMTIAREQYELIRRQAPLS